MDIITLFSAPYKMTSLESQKTSYTATELLDKYVINISMCPYGSHMN